MDHRLFWIWAQEVFGPGSGMPWHINRRYPGGLEAFQQAGLRQWRELDYISEQQSLSMSMVSIETAAVRLELALRQRWDVVTPECEQYPNSLRNITDPPAVLYSRGGSLAECGEPRVALTGARAAFEESAAAARRIAFQMAGRGAEVVTGGAVGIDCAAITGALQAGGKVICVLPVDLSSAYMSKTARLRQDVLDSGGTIVTEYFSQRSPGRGAFHQRNRVITGLCGRVVLVQAAKKSGTMIYARYARKQKKGLYVFPGPADAPEFAGSCLLLREGAAPVLCGDDVLGALEVPERKREAAQDEAPVGQALKSRGQRAEPQAGPGLDPEQQRIIDLLQKGQKSVDELIENSGIPSGRLLRVLTLMEMRGHIEAVAGRTYRRRQT